MAQQTLEDREAELRTVTVGELQPLSEPLRLYEYDPAWPVFFDADSADEPAYLPSLEAAGYVLRIREPDWHQHRMLRGTEPAVNLHVFSVGCPEIDRMLLFRDWLRGNDADRQLYERTKRELVAKDWKYVQNYADAKSAVVEEIMARALAEPPAREAPA